MPTDTPVRVRFAPSPTGRFHIGSARTALYNYLIAHQTGGQFLLRIEDTDQKRLDPTAEDEIKDSLRWLGVPWDEGPDVGGPHAPYRQSERLEVYTARALELVDHGHAYPCFCSPERLSQLRQTQQRAKQPPRYDGQCRRLKPAEAAARVAAGESHVVRFKTPKEGQTQAVDLLRGAITVDNHTIDDYVLVKSNGIPVYHLAAMVDDHEMQITHVLRGSEWLPTFPLHVLIYQAFGWQQPVWAHLSVFLNPSGKGKLSKRSAGSSQDAQAVYITDMRRLGYLPEAVNNWTALMGWSYDDRTEFFLMADLIEKFSLEKLKPSPAAVNFSKLDHFNGLHIRALPVDDLTDRLVPWFESAGFAVDRQRLARIVPLLQERIRTLDEAVEMAGFFFADEVTADAASLVGKDMDAAQTAQALERARDVVEQHEKIEAEPLEADLRALADDLGLSAGQLFGILRMAVTGQRVSPPLLESMELEGKETVVRRMEAALASLATA
ncbi:MAG TPA: glutamate--tRNA ligase [Anaerolineales bacterium]|jgi:glutamyl-tRNA synthetase